MAELVVTYQITEYVTVNVDDFQLSEQELAKLAESKAEYVIPDIAENISWEWTEKPQAKKS